MKQQVKLTLLYAVVLLILFSACKKEESSVPSTIQTVTDDYPADYNAEARGEPAAKATAEVPLAWYKLSINLIRVAPGQATGPVFTRAYGYIGLALYESVVPGMPIYKSIQKQLNGLPPLPHADILKRYYYPACANAALASILHYMYGNTSPEQNYTIDSLENVFYTSFQSMAPKEVLDRSVSFGKAIAAAIYDWSKSDGGDQAYLNLFPPYTLPVGPGLWVPQPGQAALLPYWGTNRTFIADIATNTQPPRPIPYSTNPKSEFYKEELQVYKESINQDPDHKAAALYWASIPGTSVDIVSSVLTNKSSNLATAAEAYCKVGIAMADAVVSCWITKYKYTQERPITYIKANFDTGWIPVLGTPPYPDYSSGYTIQNSASLTVLADMFGNNTTFTSPYVNSLGFPPRVFDRFSACALEVARSRFYGGIHILSSCYVAIEEGERVGAHVNALRFKRM